MIQSQELKRLSFLVAGMVLVATTALACWAAPPAETWVSGAEGKFEAKVVTKIGVVTVYALGKRDNAIWTTTLKGYSGLFSQVKLVNSGKRVVHIRGNHLVQKLTDTAIEIADQNGKGVRSLAAKVLIAELVKPAGPRMSTSPNQMWLKTITGITATRLSLTNAAGESKTINLDTGAVVRKSDNADG